MPAACRSLHRERGLKPRNLLTYADIPGRSLHRERGLKRVHARAAQDVASRSLHRERGLKLHGRQRQHHHQVAPFTGSVD